MSRVIGRDRIAITTAPSALEMFREEVRAMGLRESLSGHRPPWRNSCAERVIGTIRRE